MRNAVQVVRRNCKFGFRKFFDQKLCNIFLRLPTASENKQLVVAFKIFYKIQLVVSFQKLLYAVKSGITGNGRVDQSNIFGQSGRLNRLMKKPVDVVFELFGKPFTIIFKEDLMFIKKGGNHIIFSPFLLQFAEKIVPVIVFYRKKNLAVKTSHKLLNIFFPVKRQVTDCICEMFSLLDIIIS